MTGILSSDDVAEKNVWRYLVEEAFQTFSIVDETGMIIATSESPTSVLKMSPKDLVGRSGYDFIHPDDRPAARAELERLFGTDHTVRQLQIRLATIDQKWKPFDVYGQRISGPDGKRCVLLVWRTVPKSRVKGRSAAWHDTLTDRLVRTMPFIVFVYDVRDHRLIYISDQIESLSGYTGAEWVGSGMEKWLQIWNHDDFIPPDEYVESLSKTPSNCAFVHDARLRDRDGTWRWMRFRDVVFSRDADGQPAEIMGTIQDIDQMRRAELQLASSERRYRKIVEYGYGTYLLVDAEGVITSQSPVDAEALGFASKNQIGDSVWVDVHPDDISSARMKFGEALSLPGRRIGPIEFRTMSRGVEYRWREVVGVNLLDDPDVGSIVIHWRDIHDRRMAEEARAQIDAKFRAAIDQCAGGVTFIDASAQILYTSASSVSLSGYSMESVLGQSAQSFIHPDDVAAALERIETVVKEPDETVTHRLRVSRPNGEWCWVEGRARNLLHDPMIQAVVIYWHEVTEQVNAERRLRDSEQRLAHSQNLAHLGSWEWDVRTNEVTWSDEHYRIFGVDRESFAPGPDSFFEMVHPDDRDWVAEKVRKSIFNDLPCKFDYRIIDRKGKLRWLHVDCLIDRNEDGQAIFFRGTIQDITERVRIDAEKSKFVERLRETQKLESLGVLAGGIAHDFNNLLTTIMMSVELAQSSTGGDGESRGLLDQAMVAANRASDLCRQLLAYAGRGGLKMQPIDLNDSVREMRELLRSTIAERHRIVTELSDEPVWVVGDEGQMGQVIMNLIINASESLGEPPGSVTVRTGRQHSEDDSEWLAHPVDAVIHDDEVYIEVEDTGSGIGVEDATRLFEPFFTTKFTGRGLGLAVVSGIVRSHGGRILVESKPGRGTRFRVVMPAARSANAPTWTSDLPVRRRTTARKIIVADDDDQVLLIVAKLLEEEGFDVETSSGPEEVIELFQRTDGVAGALLDINMPGMDGFEALRRLREQSPDLPALMMTGYCGEELRRKAELAGVSILEKPFTTATLLEFILRVFGSRRMNGPLRQRRENRVERSPE